MIVATMNDLRLTAGTVTNEHCHLLGYYAPGDGGSGEFYWDATSTAADNGGTIIKVAGHTGSWLRIFSGAVTPKWFGAKGDGASNDTTPVSICMNNFDEVDLVDCNYKVADMTSARATSLRNGTISLFPLSRISVLANLNLEKVIFDALDQTVRTAILYVSPGGGIIANNCVFKNIKTSAPPVPSTENRNQYAIIADMANCNIVLDNVRFENISAMGDANGAEENAGFCGGIFILASQDITYDNPSLPTYYKTVYSKPSNVSITNCIFKNIYTIKHPSNTGPLDTDADAIRITIDDYDDRFDICHNILIDQNRFIDIQKSCVKASNFNGLIISNSVISTEKMTTTPLIGAFRLQPVKTALISNVLYNGTCTYLMYSRGSKDIRFHNISTLAPSNVTTAFQILDNSANISIGGSDIACGRFLNIETSSGAIACDHLAVMDCRIVQQTEQTPFIRIKNAPDVCISDCSITTLDNAGIDGISISDAPGFSLSDSKLFYGRTAISCIENNLSVPNNIMIASSNFERLQYATGSRHILLRASAGTNPQLTGVVIRDCSFSSRSQAARSNDEIMLLSGTDVTLSDLNLIVVQVGTNTIQAATGLIQVLQSTQVNINNVNARHNFVPTGESYTVLLRQSSKITITGVKSFNGDGVTLYESVDYIAADSIFSKAGRQPLWEAVVPVNKYYGDTAAIL